MHYYYYYYYYYCYYYLNSVLYNCTRKLQANIEKKTRCGKFR